MKTLQVTKMCGSQNLRNTGTQGNIRDIEDEQRSQNRYSEEISDDDKYINYNNKFNKFYLMSLIPNYPKL